MNITGEMAWAILGVSVVGYEMTAKDQQLLSEAVDRFIVRHPWATRAVVVYLAAHLLNLVPNQFDPLHQLAMRRIGLPWGTRRTDIGEIEAQEDSQAGLMAALVGGGGHLMTCDCEDCQE